MAIDDPNQAQIDAAEKMQDRIAKMYTDVFSNAMAYTNLVIIAGYGAMFTVWSFTNDHLAPWVSQTVALLLVVSIGVFVGFEIFKMASNARLIFSFNSTLKPGMNPYQITALLDAHNKRANRLAAWQQMVWVPVLGACIVTGYGAGGLLIWNFVCNLL